MSNFLCISANLRLDRTGYEPPVLWGFLPEGSPLEIEIMQISCARSSQATLIAERIVTSQTSGQISSVTKYR